MKVRVPGRDMVELLCCLSPGESVLVNGQAWVSLDGEFEVIEDLGEGEGRLIGRAAADALFDPDTMYEVTR